jgi:hypothetical protein
MTRGQYIAMCIIGAVAIIAYLESQRVAAALNSMMNGGGGSVPNRPAI